MTFWHLYTVWGLVLATLLLVRLFRGPRCAHAWELVDKTEWKSACERIGGGWYYNNWDLPKLSSSKVAIVMRCNKCGAAMVREIYSR